jgi:HAD superfamily hydrolase (TIGR01484 family)
VTAHHPSLRPIKELPAASVRSLKGVLTDIDDTLTTGGEVDEATVRALTDLKASGLNVIPVTGRPVGWSERFARVWPVDALVAENGAVALYLNASGQLEKIFQQDLTTRERQYSRMQQILQRIEAEVPGAQRSSDSCGRETDIAIDHSEFTQLDASQIQQAVHIMKSEGMNATVSSIHINGWFGPHNKLEGARWIVAQRLGRSIDTEREHWLYVGDSTNDELMFKFFGLSVGVANIARFLPQLQHQPRYVTQKERGAGFVELAQHILYLRQG